MTMPVRAGPVVGGGSGVKPGCGAGSGTNPPRPFTFEMRTAITFRPAASTPAGIVYCRGRFLDVVVALMRIPFT